MLRLFFSLTFENNRALMFTGAPVLRHITGERPESETEYER
jgi:hypothetical protein